jgi:hypothetical protein
MVVVDIIAALVAIHLISTSTHERRKQQQGGGQELAKAQCDSVDHGSL